mmetsp:Transcript_22043/g.61734  ORF Transcript_22043/g.61734 Transcript_22043/m.61734 type:complete len:205 (+) Transcript_22043:467-1081(+)
MRPGRMERLGCKWRSWRRWVRRKEMAASRAGVLWTRWRRRVPSDASARPGRVRRPEFEVLGATPLDAVPRRPGAAAAHRCARAAQRHVLGGAKEPLPFQGRAARRAVPVLSERRRRRKVWRRHGVPPQRLGWPPRYTRGGQRACLLCHGRRRRGGFAYGTFRGAASGPYREVGRPGLVLRARAQRLGQAPSAEERSRSECFHES